MPSASHTPGPWYVGYGATSASVYFQPLGDIAWNKKNAVATFARNPEGLANARLIAAAPDLLAAAKLALAAAESWIHDQLDGTSSLDGELAELEPVRAAIAKAEAHEARAVLERVEAE